MNLFLCPYLIKNNSLQYVCLRIFNFLNQDFIVKICNVIHLEVALKLLYKNVDCFFTTF